MATPSSFVLLALLASHVSAETQEFYVSTTGDDNWNGRTPAPVHGLGPFATLQKAIETARSYKDDPVLVSIEEGAYNQNKTLELNGALDSR